MLWRAVAAIPAAAGTQEASVFLDDIRAVMKVAQSGEWRTYELSSNAPLRDQVPSAGRIVFSETPGHATVRSGHVMFDGLYAMAVHEALQNSVPEISDRAYAEGAPIKLEAFQTGEFWTYVWTRDLSYSVHLALAAFDPQRSAESLLFKTSRLKSSVAGGEEYQIIQDTGSGGSYPVSSDRVVWALGAGETVHYLSGAERAAFLNRIYPILRGTIEQDRVLVFDPRDGLYRGEQSFLDWREQTYPAWTKSDVLPIALSKALSVNVLNYRLLSFASQCAERLHAADDATRYAQWAADLKAAINEHFYDSGTGLYSTYRLSNGLNSVRANRYDLLGESLAILCGIADPQQAAMGIARYPVGRYGPPVVWPQERDVPIYHNQAIWPFVTAYWIKAACRAGNPDAVNLGVRSLERLAAFNLSNMENVDFASGLAEVRNKAGQLEGPVINSRRQLWSVAGYLSMVQDVVFGLDTSWDGIRFRPYITPEMRAELFPGSDSIELRSFVYCGTRNQVRIHLPAAEAQTNGVYGIGSMTLNGNPIDGAYVAADRLKPENLWEIELVPQPAKPGVLPLVDSGHQRLCFAPAQAVWDTRGGLMLEGDRVKLRFRHPDATDVVFNIYRDGMLHAKHIRQTEWVDEASVDYDSVAHSYAVEAVDPETGHAAHLTPFLSYTIADRQIVIPAREMKSTGGKRVADHYEDWGLPCDELLTRPFTVGASGRYAVRTRFSNGSGPVNTGITCAVKTLDLLETASGLVVASGYLIMPQSGDWNRWDLSSPVLVELKSGTAYRLRIREDEYARNMSYLEQNERYTSWPGGGPDGYNEVNIAALQIDLLAADGFADTHPGTNP